MLHGVVYGDISPESEDGTNDNGPNGEQGTNRSSNEGAEIPGDVPKPAVTPDINELLEVIFVFDSENIFYFYLLYSSSSQAM